ncbi:MAG: hypothetical protein M0Z93_06475 [Actinomycetota bacterium]|nr:hypothetical protein [Actinomycetota bacterium]
MTVAPARYRDRPVPGAGDASGRLPEPPPPGRRPEDVHTVEAPAGRAVPDWRLVRRTPGGTGRNGPPGVTSPIRRRRIAAALTRRRLLWRPPAT